MLVTEDKLGVNRLAGKGFAFTLDDKRYKQAALESDATASEEIVRHNLEVAEFKSVTAICVGNNSRLFLLAADFSGFLDPDFSCLFEIVRDIDDTFDRTLDRVSHMGLHLRRNTGFVSATDIDGRQRNGNLGVGVEFELIVLRQFV